MHHAITQYLEWMMAKSYSTTVKTDIRGSASEGTLTSLKVLCTKLKKLQKYQSRFEMWNWKNSRFNTLINQMIDLKACTIHVILIKTAKW